MQLGIFAKIFPRHTIEEVFHAVAEHGLRAVQFNFACAGLPSLPDQIAPTLIERIGRAVKAHGITISAVSGTFNMAHPDAAVRQEGLRRFAVVAAGARDLEAPLVTLCTGTRDPNDMWRMHPDNAAPDAWRDLVGTLADALTIAEQHGIALGVEPETGNVISSARLARRLLDEMQSPCLKVVMDAANLFLPGDLPRMGELLGEAFDLLGNDIVLAHAKELGPDGHPGSLPLGAGVLDWGKYLALLHTSGFAGALIMHGFGEAQVPASMKFLRSKLASATSA